MSVNADVSNADRYAWPAGAQKDFEAGFEAELATTCARIARHMSRAGAGVIGLLPVGAELAPPARLGPFLLRLATALTSFVSGDVAFVDAWPTWSPAGTEETPPTGSRMREIHPRVLEVSPPACEDAGAAAVALQNTLAVLRRGVGLALVHLGGYAHPGRAPASLILVDQVATLVSVRRTRKAAVAALTEHIPPAKRLGATLVG
jgi:hypothetical protein